MTRARELADQHKTLDVDGGTIKLDGNYPVGTDNVALGNTALDSLTSGSRNNALGATALTAVTSGSWNIGIGTQSLQTLQTGDFNIAVGGLALSSANGASFNVAMGQTAMTSNTTGSNNTGLGYDALRSNTTASFNTAVGYQAGYSMTAGDGNTFVGYHAGHTNSGSGTYRNTFIGYGSGSEVSSGYKNTIIGSYNGNQGGLDIRTSSNNIVLSDGDGNLGAVYRNSLNKFYPGSGSYSSDGFGFGSAITNMTNLGTTPQTITVEGMSNTGMIYFAIRNIDSDQCTIQIAVGRQEGIVIRHVLIGSDVSVSETSAGVFSITGMGDGRTYTLTGSTGASGTWTLAASSTATGNTVVCAMVIGAGI